jgi:uncharacterized repeat protein (TIGR01451 family)
MRRGVLFAGLLVTAAPSLAHADDFAAGSLIVPMDTDYQDMGMLRAYGLVYALLANDVPVRWVIKSGKQQDEADFTTSATDLQSGAAVDDHGYRGGPWVIDAPDADAALPIVEAWQVESPETAVHEATAAFSGDVAATLVVAPTIAMMADGNQKIARKYMLAAGIPDSTGDLNWPDDSPDMLDPEELMGADVVDNHRDGALFDADGDPRYCQFMSMHWAVDDAEKNPDVVAEMREFLGHPTHLFAECQAVNAFENLAPHGFFLTSKGFLIGDQPKLYDYYEADTPFAQLDGPFLSVGGSEPAYTLPPGEKYKASDVVMITAADTPIGLDDVWMTGFLDGICPGLEDDPDLSAACLTTGKVSYLGGHEYDVDVPISDNPTTQGARLFLNSLFEAPCTTAEGLPQPVLTKTAPAVVDAPEVTFSIDYVNNGPLPAFEAVLTDTLPPGVTFVSATNDGIEAGGVVTWQLGNLGEGEAGSVQLTVALDGPGIYENEAVLAYRAGVNLLSLASNQTQTAFGVDPTTGDTAGSEATSAPGTDTGAGTSGGSGGTADVPTTGASGPATVTDAGGSSVGESSGDTVGESGDGGCGCNGPGRDAGGVALLLGVVALLGRRRSRAAA